MSKHPENAAIVLVGSFGTKMLSPIAQKITDLRATGSIRSWYHLDLSVNHVNTAIDGVVDLSPTHAERQAVLLHEETEDQAYRKLLNNLPDKLVEAHLDARAYPDALIFVIDPRQLISSVEMLESISRRLPRHSLVVVTELSTTDAQLPSVQTGLGDMVSLHAEDFLQTTIVTDPHSPFAAAFGLDTQHRFLAFTLIGWILSHKHSYRNPSFVNVLRTLHDLGPFAAMNFASEDVVMGPMPKGLGFAKRFVKGEAGSGDASDVLAQSRSAIDRCFTQVTTRTFPSLVSPDSACATLLSSPFRLDDERFSVCVRDNSLYVSSHYPYANCATARGNGTAYPHHIGGKFLVQASCLYPVQSATLLNLRGEKGSVKVTPLYPLTSVTESVGSNGAASAKDQGSVVRKTKAASTPRQKRTAPRGAARKNTKQAK